MKQNSYTIFLLIALILTGCINSTQKPQADINASATVVRINDTVTFDARATDDRDENVTITQSGTVDTNSVGTYTLTYTATDKAGNSATVQRTVYVVLPPDVTAPILTLNGDSTVTLFQGANYTELGATATDDRDENVSVSISGTVDSATLGTYIMTYTATDTAGNSVTVQRTVNVVLPPDIEAPVITLNGDANITLTLGESYEELGAIAHDQRDGDVNVTVSGSVDSATVGSYTITYTATDKAGNSATVQRTVYVVLPPDVTAPILTLNGDSTVTLFQGTNYTELGATATDDRDANVSVSISGTVDSATLGTYIVTYTATDTAGNSATVQRTVNVVLPPDTEVPVITLNGDVNMTLTQGESYEELGAIASDVRDGDVNVTIGGSVDTSTEGTYSITYTARDKAGNVVTVTRTVTVVAPTLTELSLESNVTTLNVGEKAELSVMATYSDGSTAELDANVEYIITPLDSVKLNGTVLTAKKDGDVTVQAKVGTTLSNTLNLNITWVVNGHTLPPEPDKTLNDSTLLGIDSNNNNVRDDMERYILQTYGKEEITIEIAFQVSRAYDTVIEHPENAWETYKVIDAAMDCESYFRNYADMFGDPILLKERILGSKVFKSLQLNTKERIRGYLLHNQRLGGGVFSLPPIDELKSKCSFETDILLKARK